MGIEKDRAVMQKIFLFSETELDYGTRSGDFCLVMQAVGQTGHSLFMWIIKSLWYVGWSNSTEADWWN